jgi:hypothetical protein
VGGIGEVQYGGGGFLLLEMVGPLYRWGGGVSSRGGCESGGGFLLGSASGITRSFVDAFRDQST